MLTTIKSDLVVISFWLSKPFHKLYGQAITNENIKLMTVEVGLGENYKCYHTARSKEYDRYEMAQPMLQDACKFDLAITYLKHSLMATLKTSNEIIDREHLRIISSSELTSGFVQPHCGNRVLDERFDERTLMLAGARLTSEEINHYIGTSFTTPLLPTNPSLGSSRQESSYSAKFFLDATGARATRRYSETPEMKLQHATTESKKQAQTTSSPSYFVNPELTQHQVCIVESAQRKEVVHTAYSIGTDKLVPLPSDSKAYKLEVDGAHLRVSFYHMSSQALKKRLDQKLSHDKAIHAEGLIHALKGLLFGTSRYEDNYGSSVYGQAPTSYTMKEFVQLIIKAKFEELYQSSEQTRVWDKDINLLDLTPEQELKRIAGELSYEASSGCSLS